MKLRIKFTKSGVMVFIGHLDMMRYFQKAMRRAEIDIAYSQGFNPHQIMSFALPLGVGVYSDGEYLDIEANSITSSEDMCRRLNEVMVEGVTVESVKLLPEQAKNAMSLVAAADYIITFREGHAPEGFSMEQFLKFCSQESIVVTKQTKKNTREIDLKSYMYEVKASEEGIYMMIGAGSANNIKPDLIFNAYAEHSGIAMDEFALMVKRLDLYADLAPEEQHKFVSLESLGEDFYE
ncbi:MAG: DUF2344 domain-containing protein [Lachnospiraceae bacterium]|nr:DUF2344 domain-containing protein [Lachnospiraceae bacterium]